MPPIDPPPSGPSPMTRYQLLQPHLLDSLRFRLTTLRTMPPGMSVRPVDRAEDGTLLQELLRLPDSVDPVSWIHREHAPEAARRTLYEALRQLRVDFQHAQRQGQPDLRHLPDDLRSLWNDFVNSWTDVEGISDPFADLTPAADDRQMASVLREVRLLRPRYAGPRGTLPEGDLPLLVDELLRLPNQVDPVGWLMEERGELVAAWTLANLVGAAQPPPPASFGEVLYRASPGDTVLFAGQAEFSFEQFVLREHGFSVDLRVRTFASQLARQTGLDHIVAIWQGFTQVTDDLGYGYFFARGGPDNLDDPSAQGDRFRFHGEYYPLPPTATRTLSFADRPARLRVLVALPRRPSPGFPPIVLGDLVFRVNLQRIHETA